MGNRALASSWVLGLCVLGSSLGASCTSAPPLPPRPTARVESVPAGAQLTTRDGQSFTAPALFPVTPGEALCLEVSLPGHAPRQVRIDVKEDGTALQGLSACALLPLLEQGGKWEPVRPVRGVVVLELEPRTPSGR